MQDNSNQQNYEGNAPSNAEYNGEENYEGYEFNEYNGENQENNEQYEGEYNEQNETGENQEYNEQYDNQQYEGEYQNEQVNEEEQHFTYRERIINELYTTEKNYVEAMDVCLKFYYNELSQKPDIISRDNVAVLFMGLDSVKVINSEVLNNMTELKKQDKLYTDIGKTFTALLPFLNVYTTYVGNSDNVNDLLAKLDGNSSFVKLLEKIRCGQTPELLDLRSYLIQVCSY